MRSLIAGWFLVLLLFSAPAHAMEPENSLYAAWVDQVTKESKIVDERLKTLESEVKRLEQEYKGAKDQIKDDKNCVKLNCDEIEELAKHIYDSLEAANLSVAMTRIGQEELESFAHNMKYATIAQIKGIQAETSKKKLLLLGLEMTQRLAHVTAGITVSYLTGDAKGAVGHGQAFLKHTYAALVNYGANQGADLMFEHKEALGKLGQDTVGTTGQETFANGFIGSVSSQIGNVRIMGVDKTGKYTKGLRSALMGDNPKATVSQAVQVVTRAVINAAMEPLVQGKRREIEEAMAAVKRIFVAQRDLYLAAMFGDVVIDMAEERQRKVQDLADRIKKMADGCEAKVRESECMKKWDAAKKAAKQNRDKATAKLKAQNEAAAEELETVREEWRLTMMEAAAHHEALQGVRDDLVDAERLAENRQKFEDLATAAPDADKRAQYKAELARLNKLESVDVLKTKEKDLAAKRKAAWDKIDALLPAIEKKREAMLEAYNKNQDTIEKAWLVYFKDMSAAHQAFLDCQGTKVSTLPEAPNPTLKELRKQLSQEVDPHIIFFALQEKLKTLVKFAGETEITAHQKNGKLCGEKEALAPVTDGECWAVSGLSGTQAMMQRTGDNVMATLYAEDGQAMTFSGTLKGKKLYLEHAYIKANRKFLRNTVADHVSDVIVDKLIALQAKAIIEGTIEKGQPHSYRVGPTPAMGESFEHDIANVTVRLLNYDIVEPFHTADDPIIPSQYCDDTHCIEPLNGTMLNPATFNTGTFHQGEAEWLKLDPAWKHIGYINVLDKDFKESPDGMFELGDKVWIEATSDMNCTLRQDEIIITVEPEKKPKKGFDVMLIETSKDSGIYRSDGGEKLDFRKKDVIDNYQGNIRFYVPEQNEHGRGDFYPMTIPIFKK